MTQRQHDVLDPICLKVFEETISGKLAVDERPGLTIALDYLRDGDMLCVQEADRLGRNLLEGLIVLNDSFQRCISVKVLEGIAAGEHTERSLILDMVLAFVEDRRRYIVRKTKNGLEAARARVRVGSRRPVVDDDKRAAPLSRRAEGQSIRTIAAGVGVSIGVVHKTLNEGEDATDLTTRATVPGQDCQPARLTTDTEASRDDQEPAVADARPVEAARDALTGTGNTSPSVLLLGDNIRGCRARPSARLLAMPCGPDVQTGAGPNAG